MSHLSEDGSSVFRIRRPPPLKVQAKQPKEMSQASLPASALLPKENLRKFLNSQARSRSKHEQPLTPFLRVSPSAIRLTSSIIIPKKIRSSQDPVQMGSKTRLINNPWISQIGISNQASQSLIGFKKSRQINLFSNLIKMPPSPSSNKSGAASTKSDQNEILQEQKTITFSLLQAKAQTPKLLKKKKGSQNYKDHPFRHLILASQVKLDKILNFALQLHRGLLYSTGCLQAPPIELIQRRKVEISRSVRKPKKNVLVLDLDETLVWNCTDSNETPDIIIEVNEPNVQGVSFFSTFIIPH